MTNKTINMTIDQIEKAPKRFKQTHKIKVSGPYDDSQAPAWFKAFAKKQEEFNVKVGAFIKKQEKFNKNQKEFNKTFLQRLNNIVKKNNLVE